MFIGVLYFFVVFFFFFFFFFFFSSRRRHTRLTCDWSSDVCSSDLFCIGGPMIHNLIRRAPERVVAAAMMQPSGFRPELPRSEERRVGKECRSRWSPEH